MRAVTVDGQGTLGQAAVASAASVQSVRASVDAIAAVTDQQFAALDGRVNALQSGLSDMSFRLDSLDESTSGGIAAAMALGGTMIVPDSNISVTLNGSTYRGEQGFAGSVAARVADRVYISGGIAGSTAKNSTGGRVGVAFGF